LSNNQIDKHNVRSIFAGKDHTLALLSTGEVLGWGGAGSGRYTPPFSDICRPANNTDVKPVYVSTPAGFTNICAGYGVSLGVSNHHQVLIWGFCQVGVGGIDQFSEEPTLVNGVDKVSKVAIGQFLYAALGQSGEVYTWGLNTDGALGRITTQINATPGLAELPPCKDIAVGDNFMIVLSSDEKLYAWGSNSSGQLGLGHLNSISIPAPISLESKVQSIAVGSTHVLVLTVDNKVFGWGSNHFGQIGQGNTDRQNTQKFINKPRPILFPEKILAIAAGMHFSLALSLSGKVYAWGWNGFGQLGMGNLLPVSTPTLIPNLSNVRAIATGEAHSLAIGKNQLFGWGNNESGQLSNASGKQMIPNSLLDVT
jgi:alpha-tubulin suppressor-like RCC1 family protein